MKTPAWLLMPALFVVSVPAQEPRTGAKVDWIQPNDGPQNAFALVRGIDAADLDSIKQANFGLKDWQSLFPVYAEQGGALNSIGLPPMLGGYRLDSDGIRFRPQFPLSPGIRYRAVFHPDQMPGANNPALKPISADILIPKKERAPSAYVETIYPTADRLPENLLKFYIQFSDSMSGGRVYNHIRLIDENESVIELPFLELDEELWDPEMKRLTLFIDPGRIKRGVKPLEDIGPALEADMRYTLIVDSAWKDANGTPLKESHRKAFTVTASDRSPPNPDSWKLDPPPAQSLRPFILRFGEPMDHALARRLIAVTDSNNNWVPGEVELGDHESEWRWIPENRWKAGTYRLMARTTIEDLAGNNIGKPFEVDLFEGVQKKLKHESIELKFEIR